MKCPIDGSTLAMGERAGLEISYCPECRGIWLDRGQLDLILERSGAAGGPPPQSAPGMGGVDLRSLFNGRGGHHGRR